MSTRSRIGIIRSAEEKTVESIYCHFDGYPEGVGQTLLNHWTTAEWVEELIALGDLSALGAQIGEDQGTDWFYKRQETLYANGYDTDDPRSTWCLAYGRDRGEKDVGAITHSIDKWPGSGQECEYLFDPTTSEWRVRSTFGNPVGWNTVADWPGWATIPEAIAAEIAAREAREKEEATG